MSLIPNNTTKTKTKQKGKMKKLVSSLLVACALIVTSVAQEVISLRNYTTDVVLNASQGNPEDGEEYTLYPNVTNPPSFHAYIDTDTNGVSGVVGLNVWPDREYDKSIWVPATNFSWKVRVDQTTNGPVVSKDQL